MTYEELLKIVTEFYSDTSSRDSEDTLDALVALKEDIETMIDALEHQLFDE